MIFLEKRGCPRTALEYCKLILRYQPTSDRYNKCITFLRQNPSSTVSQADKTCEAIFKNFFNVKNVSSLDPDDDPLCMLLIFDFLCLRCREYTTLIRLYEEWEVKNSLLLIHSLFIKFCVLIKEECTPQFFYFRVSSS